MAAAETPFVETNAPAQGGLFGLITKLATANVALTYISRHDALTGLLNQQAGEEEIRNRMEGKHPFGLIDMDLDAFKIINDTLGHPEGNRLLEDFGAHLSSKFRRTGDAIVHEEKVIWLPVSEDDRELSMARAGGDEFHIIADLSDRGRNDGLSVAQRMDNAVDYSRIVVAEFVGQQDAAIRDHKFNVSIGGAIWEPGTDQTFEELVGSADLAMYADKKAHGAPAR